MDARGLIRAVLRPHDREHGKLNEVGLSAQMMNDEVEFVVGEPQGPIDIALHALGAYPAHTPASLGQSRIRPDSKEHRARPQAAPVTEPEVLVLRVGRVPTLQNADARTRPRLEQPGPRHNSPAGLGLAQPLHADDEAKPQQGSTNTGPDSPLGP